MPIHPTRKLNDFPEIYQFAVKIWGPALHGLIRTYWYEGVTPHLNWKRQAKISWRI